MSAVTDCGEGFHCVSRVARFGRGHSGELVPERIPELKKQLKDRQTADYEWDCPVREGEAIVWKDNQKESGEGAAFCREDRDCICVRHGSTEVHTVKKDGVEKQVGRFDVEVARGEETEVKKSLLTIIPHYVIREMPDTINPMNPHADIGLVKAFPRNEWLARYKLEAPKLQSVLDDLREDIEKKYMDALCSRWVCGPKPKDAGGDKEQFNREQATLMMSKIRRFQILSNDCQDMQTTVGQLAASPKDEEFAHHSPWLTRLGDTPPEDVPASAAPWPPEVGNRPKASLDEKGKVLDCYNQPGSDKPQDLDCKELNCYHDFLDTKFQNHLMWLKSKLEQCNKEHDIPDTIMHNTALETKYSLGVEAPPAAGAAPAVPVTASTDLFIGLLAPACELPASRRQAPGRPPRRRLPPRAACFL